MCVNSDISEVISTVMPIALRKSWRGFLWRRKIEPAVKEAVIEMLRMESEHYTNQKHELRRR